MRHIEFIDYIHAPYSLCHGTLVLSINGVEVSFDNLLVSGGTWYFTEDWEAVVTEGPWEINDFNEKFNAYRFSKKEKEQLLNIINENIPYGCCGGCV